MKKTDDIYMRRAIELALKAEGLTSPNPVVGACIVRNGKVLGEGYHRACGSAHAEVVAIRRAGQRAKGSTLYITLEPCDHFGHTPPCTDAIIKSGIKKVVIGMKDPNPVNNGRGIRRLKNNGIKTVVGILEEEARAINSPYVKFITKRMPYITLKIAESLDGKIATRSGDSKWITGEDARRYVHHLRAHVDAVMVGVNTVIKDDPVLLSRTSKGRQPMRIIVDTHLRTPRNAKMFSTVKISPVIIASSEKGKRVNLRNLFKVLGGMNIMHVLVEGGGELAASITEEGLADKFLFFIAPKIIGGHAAIPSIGGKGALRMKDAACLKYIKIKRFSEDILIEAEPCLQG